MVAEYPGAVEGSRDGAPGFDLPNLDDYAKSAAAQDRLHELIPGGAHTYARGSDQYPEGMTPILTHGRGARVWDVDGREYVEYGMGLRSVTLGHCHPGVTDAIARAIADGASFTRPTLRELGSAETFLDQVPGAEMVKFAKNGSDVTTAAVKLARAATGRRLVAICRTQPFFSTDDWFIGTTEMNAGILEEELAFTVGFDYNDLDSLRVLLEQHPGDIACVILEAATATAEPGPGFLEGLRRMADDDGFVLIFDEMITGMRWSLHGAQHVYGVVPDLSTWGKALGNGFAISALAGKRALMELGGLRTSAPRVFLLSTTHGPETVGMSAYRAVHREYSEWDVVGTMERQGERLANGVRAAAHDAGLQDLVQVHGRPSCLLFSTAGPDGIPSQAYRTLFLQELLRRGVLGQSFVVSAAHTDADIDQTVEAVQGALQVYVRAAEEGATDGFLQGRPVAPAMRAFAAPRQLRPGVARS